jgi:SH3-like domain-containing protein
MKGVLFLGLVGAAIYGAILLTYDLLPHDPAANVFTGQSLGNPEDRQLRSWGTDLPALASSNSQEASLALRKAATTPMSPSRVIASANSQSKGTAYQSVEWAKVAFAAKVHSDASVSSPTLRFYRPGIALQVVGRQNDWVQVTDPISGERGWVFEQYLVPADGPISTQTAMATTSTKMTEPARANPMPSAKRRVTAPRPAARTLHDFASAQFDRRWERHAERRGGFGLFFFGRFARAE